MSANPAADTTDPQLVISLFVDGLAISVLRLPNETLVEISGMISHESAKAVSDTVFWLSVSEANPVRVVLPTAC